MAVVPIIIGAMRSVNHQSQQQHQQSPSQSTADKLSDRRTTAIDADSHNSSASSDEGSIDTPAMMDTFRSITITDALRIPLIASALLFGFYLLFKIFSKEHIVPLFSCYFCVLGVLALSQLISPVCHRLVPKYLHNEPYHLICVKGKYFVELIILLFDVICKISSSGKSHIIDYQFTTFDLILLVLSAAIGAWYLITKHWISNNLFAIAFAVEAIELLHITNMSIGCILLSGLFVYDLCWVFGTKVMVSVANSLDVPVLKFPVDLVANGWNASTFAWIGVGDIIIPGMLIAMLLRFDNHLKHTNKAYFLVTLWGYTMGLLLAFFVNWKFDQAGRPALYLYLVPCVLGSAVVLATMRNELKVLFT